MPSLRSIGHFKGLFGTVVKRSGLPLDPMGRDPWWAEPSPPCPASQKYQGGTGSINGGPCSSVGPGPGKGADVTSRELSAVQDSGPAAQHPINGGG